MTACCIDSPSWLLTGTFGDAKQAGAMSEGKCLFLFSFSFFDFLPLKSNCLASKGKQLLGVTVQGPQDKRQRGLVARGGGWDTRLGS